MLSRGSATIIRLRYLHLHTKAFLAKSSLFAQFKNTQHDTLANREDLPEYLFPLSVGGINGRGGGCQSLGCPRPKPTGLVVGSQDLDQHEHFKCVFEERAVALGKSFSPKLFALEHCEEL